MGNVAVITISCIYFPVLFILYSFCNICNIWESYNMFDCKTELISLRGFYVTRITLLFWDPNTFLFRQSLSAGSLKDSLTQLYF